MIAVATAGRIYLRRAPTDMRKSFDGLSGIVRSELGHDPLAGDLFVFVNRRRDFVKALSGTATDWRFGRNGWNAGASRHGPTDRPRLGAKSSFYSSMVCAHAWFRAVQDGAPVDILLIDCAGFS